MLVIIEPGAYIGEREKEPSARAKRIVMPFSLERRADQIRRDDVQMEVSFLKAKKREREVLGFVYCRLLVILVLTPLRGWRESRSRWAI
jgi:hypothetical protein